MQQITKYLYVVTPPENISIVVTPVKVGEAYVQAATRNVSLANVDGATPTYRLKITKDAGLNQVVVIGCNFPGDTPDDAEFDLNLLSDTGKPNAFVGPVVAKSDPLHTIEITFHIQQPG
jgi:hypothetical protein